MPFSSRKQRAYLFSQKPDVAAEFESKTSPEEEKDLPEYSSKDGHKKAIEKLKKQRPGK